MSKSKIFKIGDIIVARYPHHSEWPERRIIGYDGDGYLWEYPDLPSSDSNVFSSLCSTDSKFEFWILKSCGN